MTHWRRFLIAAIGALSIAGIAAPGVGADENRTLIEFDSMTPIGAGGPTARHLPGGGLPWLITSGTGRVTTDGHVHVKVRGLILAAGPPNLIGTNPFLQFEAVVSCVTAGGVIVNVETKPSRASVPGGSSTINDKVGLPSRCMNPEVFVGANVGGSFHWFAVSNADDSDD